jgi:transcriptional regulator with XRE-family HTH domain
MMHEINFADLGMRLAYWRRSERLNQDELARQIGIHPVTLSHIENGKLPGVTVAVLARLAMRLDISIDQLLQWQPGTALTQSLERARLTTGGEQYGGKIQ